MLSLTRGKDIATFKEGRLKNKTIKLYGKDDFSIETKPDLKVPIEERGQLLGRDFFKSLVYQHRKSDIT